MAFTVHSRPFRRSMNVSMARALNRSSRPTRTRRGRSGVLVLLCVFVFFIRKTADQREVRAMMRQYLSRKVAGHVVGRSQLGRRLVELLFEEL